jgi:hypothetical protein
MKKAMFAVLLGLFVLASAGPTLAQTSSDIALTRASIQAKRQALVSGNLGLTEDEALAFWPVYRDYRLEMARVGDRLVKLITDFAASRESLTDEQATKMLNESLSIQSDELSVKKKFLGAFRKILPPKKVVRFYQIENKLDAIIRAEIADIIPLTP